MFLGTLVLTCVAVVTVGEKEYKRSHNNQINEGFSSETFFPVSPSNHSEPGFAQGYLLTKAAQTNNAVCLDGTPAVYYHRKGNGTGSKKWFISQQGGGWCQDINSCATRAEQALGSTKYDGPSMKLDGGYMSLDKEINPLMYNWNAVFLRYCDGGSLSGDKPTPTVVDQNTTIHFRGRAILDAEIESLLNDRGMNEATDVVVSGCSAGGLATFLHCDHWATAIMTATNGAAKVVCMPDSGFFLDEELGPKYHLNMQKVYTLHQSSSKGLNAACVAAEDDTSNCIFAQHTLPYIKTPIFMLQSQYDSWQSTFVAGACNGWPPHNCNTTIMNKFGKNLTTVMKNLLLSNPKHGAFLDSCQHHCGAGGPPAGGNWGQSKIDGDLQGVALKKWYELGSEALPNKGFYNQDQTYPCANCCSQGPPPVPPRCVQPISAGCNKSCCNTSAWCGECGNCINTKTGSCANCWKNGWCFPPCMPCYVPYPVPPGSHCDLPSCSSCCEGGPCYGCQLCRDSKDGLCAHCWSDGCMPNCEGCWANNTVAS